METNTKKSANKWDLLITGSDKQFFDGFLTCYDDLYRLGFFLYRNKELSKECIQLLFIELWKLRDKSPQINNTKEYLLKIYKRILYKQYKILSGYSSRITLMQHSSDFEEYSDIENDQFNESLADHHWEQQRLLFILSQLSGRQRELIELRYLQEKSIDEIAAITSLTPRTIYNTLHNALTKLREAVG